MDEFSGSCCQFPSGVVRLGDGITIDHLQVTVSDDGHCLLICCGPDVVAMQSAMGGDVEELHFASGERYSVTEAIRRIEAQEDAGRRPLSRPQ